MVYFKETSPAIICLPFASLSDEKTEPQGKKTWLELGEKGQHDPPPTTHHPPPTACFEGGKSKNFFRKKIEKVYIP